MPDGGAHSSLESKRPDQSPAAEVGVKEGDNAMKDTQGSQIRGEDGNGLQQKCGLHVVTSLIRSSRRVPTVTRQQALEGGVAAGNRQSFKDGTAHLTSVYSEVISERR